MKNFYIDSLQIHSNDLNPNGIYVQDYSGLDFSELRLTSYNRPGEYGAFVSNNLYGGRRITLEGVIFSQDIPAYELSKREFVHSLAIERDSNGVVIPKFLKFRTMDDVDLQVEVYVMDRPKIQPNSLFSARFFVDLFAPDFFISGQNLLTETIIRGLAGGVIYPVVYPAVYAPGTGGSQVVTNAGNVESFPIIHINGPATNPTVQNSTLGRYITLNTTLLVDETIIIDMKKRTILKGNQSLIANKTDESEFWWLEVGDNTLKFLTSSSGDTGNMAVYYRNAYLGT